MPMDASEILTFWLEEVGPEGWYTPGAELDDTIRTRFEGQWRDALAEKGRRWSYRRAQSLAMLILLDQFPRNMFRGTAEAFASDALARSLAIRAIKGGHDLRTPEPERQFYYLPLEHSEIVADQDRCVRLMAMRLSSLESLLHARAHRAIIRQFGRFPFRNAALGRATSRDEQAWLDAGGYMTVVERLRAEDAAHGAQVA